MRGTRAEAAEHSLCFRPSLARQHGNIAFALRAFSVSLTCHLLEKLEPLAGLVAPTWMRVLAAVLAACCMRATAQTCCAIARV